VSETCVKRNTLVEIVNGQAVAVNFSEYRFYHYVMLLIVSISSNVNRRNGCIIRMKQIPGCNVCNLMAGMYAIAIKTEASYYNRSTVGEAGRQGGCSMPVITISMAPTNAEVKKELIERVTAEAIAVTGVPAIEFTTFIEEYPYDNIGRAGMTMVDYRASLSK